MIPPVILLAIMLRCCAEDIVVDEVIDACAGFGGTIIPSTTEKLLSLLLS